MAPQADTGRHGRLRRRLIFGTPSLLRKRRMDRQIDQLRPATAALSDPWFNGGSMAWLRGYLLAVMPLLAGLALACHDSDQDRKAHRRDLARQMCEDAVRDRLASRATAQFAAGDEHVYYDSLGGAGVSGIVATAAGQRRFACLLTPASDTTWNLSAAQLLD
jgi:hypothetical protein